MNALYAVVPTYRPVGGVIKVLDYAVAAADAGWDVVIACEEPFDPGLAVFEVPHLAPLRRARHIAPDQVAVTGADIALISWPPQYPGVAARLGADVPHEHIVHLVQNVRHADPSWLDGLGRRLLARPLSRIFTNHLVEEACAPLVHPTSLRTTIPLGHDVDFFWKDRTGALGAPIRVGYPTWKSAVGARVAHALAGDDRFEFEAIEGVVAWPDLREAYHRADVILGCPIDQEGIYLPGVEAMAAGALLVIPDAGGNMSYCRFGENCLAASLEDEASYVAALKDIAGLAQPAIDGMRSAAHSAAREHSLASEAGAFTAFLSEIEARARPRRHVPG
jgi:hypothetical protein